MTLTTSPPVGAGVRGSRAGRRSFAFAVVVAMAASLFGVVSPAQAAPLDPADPNTLTTPVLSSGQPAGTLHSPKEVVIGEPITISGTGWLVSDDSEGSGGPVFVNQPSGGTGPVTVQNRTIENQIPGSTYSDARAHGAWKADANGDWEITIPFPTPDNSSLTAETAWQVGQEQTLRILTGSLVSGDRPRTVSVPFTIVAADEEPEPTGPVIVKQPEDATYTEDTTNVQSISVCTTGTESAVWQWLKPGETEWSAVEPIGNDPFVRYRAGISNDAAVNTAGTCAGTGATERVDFTTRPDRDGIEYPSGTQFRAVLTGATGTTTSTPATITHTLELAFLEVTEQPQNVTVAVGQTATFTAVADGNPQPTRFRWQSKTGDADWRNVASTGNLVNGRATLTLENVTAEQSGTQYRVWIRGSQTGAPETYSEPATLTVTDAEDPASIAVRNSTVEQYDNVWFDLADFAEGTKVRVELVNGAGEKVSEALFTIGADGNTADPDGQTYRRAAVPRDAAPGTDYKLRVVDADTDGVLAESGDVTVTALTTRVYNPGDHAAGTEDLEVQRGGVWTFLAQGFAPNGKLTATAQVGGETIALSGIGQISASEKAWQLDANGDVSRADYTRVQIPADVMPGDFEVTFTDGTKSVTRTLEIGAPQEASVTVEPSAELGGTLRVTGVGFTHPTDGGSRVAIKINDGAYSRVDSSTHQNRTIWWIADADENGNFEIEMPIPNGTTADDAEAGTLGSTPALEPGEGFSLRFLTGSLKPGDQSRTKESEKFEITAPSSAVAPVVTSQPADVSVVEGQRAVFTAAASGEPAPSVKWQSRPAAVSDPEAGWLDVVGATGSELVLDTTVASQNGAQYRAVFENTAGTVASDPATLTVEEVVPPLKPVNFIDVPKSHKFYTQIQWMAQNKITTGTKTSKGLAYQPKAATSREAMAAFLFRMYADDDYVAPAKSPFADVKKSDKFYKEIAWMAEEGISTGTKQKKGLPKYEPKAGTSREAMAAFLYRAEGVKGFTAPAKSPFSDVKKSDKFYKQIAWMAAEGISTGTKQPKGLPKYEPKSSTSREAMSAFLYRIAN